MTNAADLRQKSDDELKEELRNLKRENVKPSVPALLWPT